MDNAWIGPPAPKHIRCHLCHAVPATPPPRRAASLSLCGLATNPLCAPRTSPPPPWPACLSFHHSPCAFYSSHVSKLPWLPFTWHSWDKISAWRAPGQPCPAPRLPTDPTAPQVTAYTARSCGMQGFQPQLRGAQRPQIPPPPSLSPQKPHRLYLCRPGPPTCALACDHTRNRRRMAATLAR